MLVERFGWRAPTKRLAWSAAPQRPASLHVERLVDRLVGDPHRLIIGEVDLQPGGYLLRAPRARPSAILAVWLVASPPGRRRRTRHRGPVRPAGLACEALLNVITQLLVDEELRGLRPACDQLRLPLRNGRAILELPATRGRVAAQLSGDRRRRAPQPAGHLPHPDSLTIE